ncbi:MAG TPA: UDP-N-acetylmuramoyl-L-alanine--D-glutamate ligase [Pyrinomonadaceae bacterium]|nr:UDP-N-acetylmuramoyl-L-alanine--D-glutamate ligase [Pyrinomonadaceae bacterium]
MELAGKKVLIVGAARSGIAAARFLLAQGAIVALTDQKPIEKWTPEAVALKESGVGLLPGEAPSWLLDQLDLVVVSPGVPATIIPIRYAERAGAEVIGEVELAARYLKGRLVAITGSNGKTTTTSLISELLRDAGMKVQVGGNIGRALISMVDSSRDDGWTVAELSSFQLETIKTFHPSIAIVLNVTPNHMDRYETFNDYAAAKHRIFMNQTPDDTAVLNADDPTVSSWASGLRAKVMQFSVRKEVENGVFLRGRELIYREQVLLNVDEMKLRGLHNVENVAAALAAGIATGASIESMNATVKRFDPVEHRLEFVAEVGGVKFYNDSKATSVDATLKALEAFAQEPGKVVLILGGRGKKAPYAPLEQLIRTKVRKLVLIGEDAETIANELGNSAAFERASDMKDAVSRSFAAAEKDDVVLLAPACASFDMFDSFEHRGKVFKEEVRAMGGNFPAKAQSRKEEL